MKIPGLLLLSASLALAQTPAADQAARSYKVAHDKLSVKHEADMGKKTGDKEKMKKAYRKCDASQRDWGARTTRHAACLLVGNPCGCGFRLGRSPA